LPTFPFLRSRYRPGASRPGPRGRRTLAGRCPYIFSARWSARVGRVLASMPARQSDVSCTRIDQQREGMLKWMQVPFCGTWLDSIEGDRRSRLADGDAASRGLSRCSTLLAIITAEVIKSPRWAGRGRQILNEWPAGYRWRSLRQLIHKY
jgi:hypothetical protein